MTTQTDSHPLSSFFAHRVRGDGFPFYVLADDRPDWLADAVHAAHDDELPNDWRYQVCAHIVAGLEDGAEPDELADTLVDIYTADLIGWLSADASRTAYCDEAISDGIWDPAAARHADTLDLIRAGQYVAISQMVDILATAIEENRDAS